MTFKELCFSIIPVPEKKFKLDKEVDFFVFDWLFKKYQPSSK